MEIPVKKRHYRVMLSEARLRSSHLWNFVEEVQQGIYAPPFELILHILCLRHAIHVVYRGSNMQLLTSDKLSLV